jgi:uncharacterized membrane protein YbaN (DUF454 family)
MQTAYLKDIADVRTGYTFRKAVSLESSTHLLGLQIGDVRQTKVIDPSTLVPIQWEGKGDPPILQPGEVVLVAKGDKNYAAIFLDHDHQVAPSSQFLVLSVKNTEKLSPEFLCWLLNYPDIQQKLTEFQVGTKMYSISKKTVQEKLLRLESLFEKETRLIHALLRNREVMVHGMSKKLLFGEMK